MPTPPPLTDRQRVEIAIPAHLVHALVGAPNVFNVPNHDTLAGLTADLAQACLEPLTGLLPKKRASLIRRIERISTATTATWRDRPALSIALTLWYFLKDLTDREILILWEGSAMARAVNTLLPMFEHGFEEHKRDQSAQKQARRLLASLQAEGLYC